MDDKLKAKWIKALRSKKFKQGRQVLHDKTTDLYCCLGVLCVVADKSESSTGGIYKWLDQVTGDYGPFVVMNDDDGKSFSQIAKYIEKTL